MGRGDTTDAYLTDNAWEQPEHAASVKPFHLDTFEVTVGRFRRFVELYPSNVPGAGDGVQPNVKGTGWNASWSPMLLGTKAELESALATCDDTSWTTAGSDARPINCVTWYEAQAFCIWDGGFLPTEVQWEFVAAGGMANQLYPWGNTPPTKERANYGCIGDGAAGCTLADLHTVGAHPMGKGTLGHMDLGGNVGEWIFDTFDLDWYKGAGASCDDCVNLADWPDRPIRGGAYAYTVDQLRAASRRFNKADERDTGAGFRCARK